jgi:hypothetical protein
VSQQELQRLKVVENAVEGRLSVAEAAEPRFNTATGVVSRSTRCPRRPGTGCGSWPAESMPDSTRVICAKSRRGARVWFSAGPVYRAFCARRRCGLRRSGDLRSTVRAGNTGHRRACWHRWTGVGTTGWKDAHFQAEHDEDSACYLRLCRAQVEGPGIPLAIYPDRHATLQRNDKHRSLEEELAGKQFPTQASRALEELGFEVIVARSPQAKGGIERT